MARRDAEIDRLFQLPPGEFTAARNALAKTRGPDGAEIRALSKPPLAAWAVNQLFWNKSDVYNALVESAEAMRRANKAVLGGQRADIRAAGREHDHALEAALRETLSLLQHAGHPATDATRQAIVNTLRALPADEEPGRLTHTLQPGGFELLSGIKPRAGPSPPRRLEPRTARAAPESRGPLESRTQAKAHERAAQAREAMAVATRDLRDAEQAARRDEFERARAGREAERAARRLKNAEQALAEAERETEEARRAHGAAERRREEAERHAARSAEQLDAARDRVEAARAALEAATSPSSRGR